MKNKSLIEIISKVNHPWLLSTSPPRRLQNSVLGMLKEKFVKAAALSKAKGIIPGYDFPRQFLQEAQHVSEHFFNILSDAEQQTNPKDLGKVMVKLLADAFASSNQKLRSEAQMPKWKIRGKPKLSLMGIHMTIGPNPKPQGYEFHHILPFMSLVVPKDDVEFYSYPWQVKVINDAKKDGMFMRINVRMMNSIDFYLGQDVDTRHYVDLEFMSPHFNPWDEIQYLDAAGEWNLNWEWKLSDVDFFLQSQMINSSKVKRELI